MLLFHELAYTHPQPYGERLSRRIRHSAWEHGSDVFELLLEVLVVADKYDIVSVRHIIVFDWLGPMIFYFIAPKHEAFDYPEFQIPGAPKQPWTQEDFIQYFLEPVCERIDLDNNTHGLYKVLRSAVGLFARHSEEMSAAMVFKKMAQYPSLASFVFDFVDEQWGKSIKYAEGLRREVWRLSEEYDYSEDDEDDGSLGSGHRGSRYYGSYGNPGGSNAASNGPATWW
jgi:hypothetical protein